MRQKPITAAIAGIAVVAFLVFMGRGLMMPAVAYSVKNDTSQVVSVTGCGERDQTAQPAEQINVKPSKRALNSNCIVTQADGDYLGCLTLPSNSSSSLEVTVSGARKDIGRNTCLSM